MYVPPKLHMTQFYVIESQIYGPGTPTYMEVLSGREDCPCEAFRRATGEDLVVRERDPIRTDRP